MLFRDAGRAFAPPDFGCSVAFRAGVDVGDGVRSRRRRNLLIFGTQIFGRHVGKDGPPQDGLVVRAVHGLVITGVLFGAILNLVGKFLAATAARRRARC